MCLSRSNKVIEKVVNNKVASTKVVRKDIYEKRANKAQKKRHDCRFFVPANIANQ